MVDVTSTSPFDVGGAVGSAGVGVGDTDSVAIDWPSFGGVGGVVGETAVGRVTDAVTFDWLSFEADGGVVGDAAVGKVPFGFWVVGKLFVVESFGGMVGLGHFTLYFQSQTYL